MESVSLEGEGSDTLFAEIAGVVSVHGGSHVGETTSITSTS